MNAQGTQTAAAAESTRHVTCRECRCIDTADTLSAGPAGVGWCIAQSQYRSMSIERKCADFHFLLK